MWTDTDSLSPNASIIQRAASSSYSVWRILDLVQSDLQPSHRLGRLRVDCALPNLILQIYICSFWVFRGTWAVSVPREACLSRGLLGGVGNKSVSWSEGSGQCPAAHEMSGRGGVYRDAGDCGKRNKTEQRNYKGRNIHCSIAPA